MSLPVSRAFCLLDGMVGQEARGREHIFQKQPLRKQENSRPYTDPYHAFRVTGWCDGAQARDDSSDTVTTPPARQHEGPSFIGKETEAQEATELVSVEAQAFENCKQQLSDLFTLLIFQPSCKMSQGEADVPSLKMRKMEAQRHTEIAPVTQLKSTRPGLEARLSGSDRCSLPSAQACGLFPAAHQSCPPRLPCSSYVTLHRLIAPDLCGLSFSAW